MSHTSRPAEVPGRPSGPNEPNAAAGSKGIADRGAPGDRTGPGSSTPAPTVRANHFIEDIVEADNAAKKWGVWGPGEKGREDVPRVHTRFPPEPNGWLHVGHAKSICLNFSLAKKYNGKFNLRFDDTNPAKEEQEYVDAIKRDVKWLGADWEGPNGGGLFFASDCFGRMYEFAEELIRKGKAYVCDLTADEVSKQRGIPQKPGIDSPYRNRPPAESLDLLARMRKGEFPNGSRTVRARIDMASPNLNMRDPVLYRILHEEHHNTGSEWCIYPMYDWAHGFEDSTEGITHSICTLEFENHRPLYDWFIDAVNEGRTGDDHKDGGVSEKTSGSAGPAGASKTKIHHPQQIEFAKLRPTFTVMSKRNLLKMVQDGVVQGWDDPRMPTISALRRRGYTPESIRNFCDDIGVTRTESVIDLGRLENAVRDHLNKVAPRRMVVLRPLKVVITNWADGGDGGAGRVEMMEAVNNPEDSSAGTRQIAFSRELYIERDDFMENPPKGYFRLAPGAEVRLRYAYWVRCTEVVKDASGNVTEVRCTYDPQTRGGNEPPPGPDGKTRKVKGTIHWVSAAHAVDAEVRLFDRLFSAEDPGKRTGNAMDDLNPSSLEVLKGAKAEPSLATRTPDEPTWPDGIRRFQFERSGYFCVDCGAAGGIASGANASGAPSAADKGGLVFNRTVTLRDTWAKVAGKG